MGETAHRARRLTCAALATPQQNRTENVTGWSAPYRDSNLLNDCCDMLPVLKYFVHNIISSFPATPTWRSEARLPTFPPLAASSAISVLFPFPRGKPPHILAEERKPVS